MAVFTGFTVKCFQTGLLSVLLIFRTNFYVGIKLNLKQALVEQYAAVHVHVYSN